MAWRDVRTFKVVDFTSKNVVLFKNLNTGVRDYKYICKANVLNDFRRVKSMYSYRTRVTCSGCGKIVDSNYKGRLAKSSKPIGQKLVFYPVLSASKTKEDEEP